MWTYCVAPPPSALTRCDLQHPLAVPAGAFAMAADAAAAAAKAGPATPPATKWSVIRIGPARNGYIYDREPEKVDAVHGEPLWKCRIDVAGGQGRLWMFKNPEGKWQANSAPEEREDPIHQGLPAFRCSSDKDVTVPGYYEWQYLDRGNWRGSMGFDTVPVDDDESGGGGGGGDESGGRGGGCADESGGDATADWQMP